jgi:MtrB/PioB family decaheme-associated outer membrane protein
MKSKLALALSTLLTIAAFGQPAPQATPPTPPPAGTPGPEAKPPDEASTTPAEATYDFMVDFGFQAVHNDTGSGKFTEYRDVPNGGVLPLFRVRSTGGTYDFQLTGENTARTDQRYTFRVNSDWLRVNGDYNQIPHRFGVGHTLEQLVGSSSYQISDTLQASFQNAIAAQYAISKPSVNFAFLSNLVAPSLKTANPVNLELLRKRGYLDFAILPNAAVDTHLTYFVESRSGNRAAGTSFGFGNVVETPEIIDYRTTDIGLTAEMPFTQGILRGGLRINTFKDAQSSYTFDNPFRITDSTDPSAYTAPASGSIGGPVFGRISTPPDNKALNATLGILYKLPYHSRISGDINLGRWTQNDTFIPYTTNTAIITPVGGTDVNSLPAKSLHGEVNTKAANVMFTSAPVAKLNLTARLRYYDFDNNTPRITFPGYVRFDAVWTPIARITTPYSFKNSRIDLTANYDVGFGTVEGGFRSEKRDHEFREVEHDTENVLRLGTDIKTIPWTVFRISYEFGKRSINHYDPEEAEDAGFVVPPAPSQPPTLRRYDINARDVDRVVSMLTVTPRDGNLSLDFNYVYNLDKYKEAEFGLQRWKNDSFSAEATYAPSDRWNANVFLANEFIGGTQVGEQNSAGILTLDPKNDWIAYNTDHVHSLGAGWNFGIIPKKIDTNLGIRYQRADGNAQLTTRVKPSNLNPKSIPNFDDTKLWTTTAELTYHLIEHLDFAVGGWIEKYDVNDAAQSDLPNYTPGSFFLSPNNLDYRGTVGYVRASYHW